MKFKPLELSEQDKEFLAGREIARTIIVGTAAPDATVEIVTLDLQVAIDEFHESQDQFLVAKAGILAADWGEGLSFFEHPIVQAFAKARTRYRAAVRDLADGLQATEQRVRVVLVGSGPCPYCQETVADDVYMQHLQDAHPVKEILEGAGGSGLS